jgi:hypothetical protein
VSAATVDARLEELKFIHDAVEARIRQLQEAKALGAEGRMDGGEPGRPKSSPPSSRQPGAAQRGADGAPTPPAPSVEASLLKLPWTVAKSGSCEYNRAVPADVLSAARAASNDKHEVKGEKFLYVLKDDGAILRFKRKGVS